MFQNTHFSWFPFLNNDSDFSQKKITHTHVGRVSCQSEQRGNEDLKK